MENSKKHWFSKTSVFWTSKGCERRYFTSQTLIDANSFLITKCYFAIGNLACKDGHRPSSILNKPLSIVF